MFPPTFMLVIMQNCVSLVFALVIGNLAPATHKTFALRQRLTPQIALKWAPAAVLFTIQLCTSLEALKRTSVPTTIVIK